MYTIRKKFAFSAAHHLKGLAKDHPCSRQHGHNYVVEIILASNTLTPVCFIRDYRELDAFKRYIDMEVDHRDLNVVFSMQTTAENLAEFFFKWCKKRWPETSKVAVSETPKTWAEYSE
jgi:6-pyruvoyltetrahydropterin/6-carboxytetrahydropterin synthase